MPNSYTSATLSGTYNDDWNENDNYHQILFNTGRSLQARELTQLQTMIYAELSRLGKNVFKEGAIVNPGSISVNSNIDYIKVSATNQGGAFADIPIGTVFKNPLTNVEARVLDVKPKDDVDFTINTLYIQYINSGNGTISEETITFGDEQTLYDQSGTGYEIITEIPNATGKGVKVTVGEGDFFVLGRFVHTTEQSIFVSPYTNSANTEIGFKVIQDVVTVNDTVALYDNASGIVNRASPGADRYRIRLQLTTRDKVTDDDTFVFLARIENSKVAEVVTENDAYNQINDVLALRTKEESGNYIVNPFSIELSDAVAGDSSLELTVGPGIAYINGHRVERPSATTLRVPRPQVTQTVQNDVIPIEYGNYFLSDSNKGLPTLDYSLVTLYNALNASGDEIGTARIRSVEKQGDQHRVYVFDVLVDSDKSLRDVRSIGTSATNRFDLFSEAEGTKLYKTTENNLLFPTSRPRPESFNDVILRYQKYDGSLTANVSGEISLSTLPVGQSYVDTSNWIVSIEDSVTVDHTVGTPTNNGRDVTISGLTDGVTYKVLSYAQKTATRKAKTLTATTDTLARQTDSANNTFYEFTHVDIFEVDSARANTSSGLNMLSSLALDDGQRDNFYAKGRLYINASDSAPPNLYVNYRYFARSATGDFFDVTSYTNLPVPYADIPNHVLKDGTLVNLRNYLDFRSDETNFGTSANLFKLPKTGDNITADISYYLPRADKVLVSQEGEVSLLMGQQAGNPQYKDTPENSLELYKIIFNANTIDENDVQITPIEHKRYTMADIAKLDAKIDQLEEYTTLSLLELEQKLTAALDSAGNVRVECGSQVDDFSDQTGADTRNDDYSASLDPESKLIRPSFEENNIRLIQNASLSSNVVKKGDNFYLNYDSEEWASQPLASRGVKVNPFGVVDNVGTLKLSPSSDEWKESIEEATKAVPGANRLDTYQAYLWNNWMWNWSGRSIEDLNVSPGQVPFRNTRVRSRAVINLRENYFSSFSSLPRKTGNGRFISRVVSSETLRTMIGNRTIDVALIPWMRARKIYFHAKGLKPNTKFTPFFDGTKVSDWCREESSFVRWADRDDDIGNQYTDPSVTEHPDGSSELISDENGEIIGSFFVPNIRPSYYVSRINLDPRLRFRGLRFRAGIREFKLLDIEDNDWAAADSKCFTYYAAIGAIPAFGANITTTRPQSYITPFAWRNNQFYTSQEVQNTLNNVIASDVNLVDPKLSGLYGPTSAALSAAALSGIDANGQMSQVLSDYINVDRNQFASSQVNTLSVPQNPLAQTFYVDNPYGVVLTSVQLFFRTKDSGNLPVSIHLRPVVDGKPSSNNIVPDSHVYLNPSDVVEIGLNPTLSEITIRPTTFEFEEPVYLQPFTHYAIVVTSQSTEYELFSAKTQERVFGSTSRTVTTQPAPGSLYLPQNGLVWNESKDQDLMYRVKRAKFDLGGGSLILENARLPDKLLGENPLRTYEGTRKIYVKHMCHGHEPGDEVRIDEAIDVAGISATTYLNDLHTIDSADINGYSFTLPGAAPTASSSTFGGGSNVLARRNAIFNVVNPQIETIIPKDTSIEVSAKFAEGKNISSTRITANDRWSRDEEYQRITLKQNVDFDTPKAIYNTFVETNEFGSGEKSTYVKVDFKTASDYVSPIIDMQRASLVLVGYCQDDPTVTPAINPVDETQPSGGTTGAKHITTPVVLEQDAVGIEAKASVVLSEGTAIDFYYRTATSDENIYDKNWKLYGPTELIPNDNSGEFKEITWLPGGPGGYLQPFNQAQVKLVMRGSDRHIMMKNLRIRYLAV